MFEHSIKNLYVGEVYKYSYDFRNSSVSAVQNEGWTISNTSTLNFGSNGMRATNSTSSTLTKSAKLTNANKIQITANVNLTTGNTTGAVVTGMCLNTAWDNNFALGRIWASTYNSRIIDNIGNYQGNGSDNYYSGTGTSGSQTLKIVYDLGAKTMTSYRILNGAEISKTSTLSDTQVSNIKACPYWRIELDAGTGGAYISDIDIIVE